MRKEKTQIDFNGFWFGGGKEKFDFEGFFPWEGVILPAITMPADRTSLSAFLLESIMACRKQYKNYVHESLLQVSQFFPTVFAVYSARMMIFTL